METLVSQAKGANNLRLCGVYLQRGRILAALLFVPMMMGFLISKNVLVGLGQDESVIHQAYLYILSVSPGMFLLG